MREALSRVPRRSGSWSEGRRGNARRIRRIGAVGDRGLHMSYRARGRGPADFVLTRYRSRCLDRWRPALLDE